MASHYVWGCVTLTSCLYGKSVNNMQCRPQRIFWSGKSLAGTKWKMLHKNKMWLLWDLTFQAISDYLYVVGQKQDCQVSGGCIDEWVKDWNQHYIWQLVPRKPGSLIIFQYQPYRDQREHACMKARDSPETPFQQIILISLLTSIVVGASAVKPKQVLEIQPFPLS